MTPFIVRRIGEHKGLQTRTGSMKNACGEMALLRLPMLHPKRQIFHFSATPYMPGEEVPTSDFRHVFTPENTVRCAERNKEILSNARYVQWDNGDVTLHVGGETYFLKTKQAKDPHVVFERSEMIDETTGNPLRGAVAVMKPVTPILCEPVKPSNGRRTSVDTFLSKEKLRQRNALLPRIIPPTASYTYEKESSKMVLPPRAGQLLPAELATFDDPHPDLPPRSLPGDPHYDPSQALSQPAVFTRTAPRQSSILMKKQAEDLKQLLNQITDGVDDLSASVKEEALRLLESGYTCLDKILSDLNAPPSMEELQRQMKVLREFVEQNSDRLAPLSND